jgi:hypothetical protein
MADPRNVSHDKRLQKKRKPQSPGASRGPYATRGLGVKPHQHPLPAGHGPDADEPVDKTESGEEP